MNNFSICTADRSTHIKIVVVSLVASIVVLALGISTRVGSSEAGTAQMSRPILKPEKPTVTPHGSGPLVTVLCSDLRHNSAPRDDTLV